MKLLCQWQIRRNQIRHRPDEAIELYLAKGLSAWGVWMALPIRTFDRSPVYGTLIKIMELLHSPLDAELSWGIVVALVGLFQIHAVFCGNQKMRSIAALVSAGIFLFLAVNFQISLPTSPSLVWFMTFVSLELYCYWMNGANRRVVTEAPSESSDGEQLAR